jgi:hypothetical protein
MEYFGGKVKPSRPDERSIVWWFHFRQICAVAGYMCLLLIGK